MKYDINLQTKVSDLLKAFPQLEDVLLDISPVFSKLKNPILRKTVAKVATLKQVAEVAGIQPAELINTLRKSIGLPPLSEIEHPSSQEAPAWVHQQEEVYTFDLRPLIAAGQHPKGQVIKRSEELLPNQVLKLLTPFKPAPLIDELRNRGFEVWSSDSECFVRLPK